MSAGALRDLGETEVEVRHRHLAVALVQPGHLPVRAALDQHTNAERAVRRRGDDLGESIPDRNFVAFFRLSSFLQILRYFSPHRQARKAFGAPEITRSNDWHA